MFNGSIPIILDSLKQHYFIDRDGKMFRHVLNFMRTGTLTLPENFPDADLLLEEARFYDLHPLVKAIEAQKKSSNSPTNGNTPPKTKVKMERVNADYCDIIAVNISPDLGERISLSAERSLIEEVFPELTSALMDSRNSGWNMDNRYVIRFPLNGFCKLNSVQVFQRLLSAGFEVLTSNGGGVEGQQFSEYLLAKRIVKNT